ncbi:ACT domain-containing protein ACR3 isoform X1 [Selaginella moellendorffii]|nr:ACT domain-containing protein ACR3 isoform X1 [Selaginella moellendorffii]|eukprot:XP_002990728.2 ACT domain-containing protein ACR3 isoform X1 [Selaginella moellendorffii]
MQVAGVRMSGRGCPYFDPDYDTLISRLNAPSVVIDNSSCDDATLVKVDSANKHGILLEVVQVLTDLDLTISKAYISSDGGWFMDVFHVTDKLGHKLRDQGIIDYIQQSLGDAQATTSQVKTSLAPTVGTQSSGGHTAIELSGRDRPGLLSEISGVLTGMTCNVVAAEVWTHNKRVACVVYVTDEATGCPIKDPEKLARMKEQLSQVLRGDDENRLATTDFSSGLTHTERRLHQMMLADRDYDVPSSTSSINAVLDARIRPVISLRNCLEKGYSVVSVQCKDRPKLLFDTVCTLTDMEYVVFHASARADGPYAYQEYYIRHMDGCTLDLDAEQERVVKCLEAAIERRVSEGLRLELCTRDRVGLLSDVTRVFREKGLSVTRADVSTRGDRAVNVFYVTDTSGKAVSMKVVEALRLEIGQAILEVKEEVKEGRGEGAAEVAAEVAAAGGMSRSRFSFGNLSERFFHGLGLVKSYS